MSVLMSVVVIRMNNLLYCILYSVTLFVQTLPTSAVVTVHSILVIAQLFVGLW